VGVYDQASHYTLKTEPDSFFLWRFPLWVSRFKFLGWADTSTIAFPGEPDRTCDTVAEFAPRDGSGPYRLLDLEFQSEPDEDMPERQGEYLFRLRRELRRGEGQGGKYRVVGVVVNLTGAPQATDLEMREPALGQAGFWLRVHVVTMRNEQSTELLARIASGELSRGLLPWIPLMSGADDPGIMAEWRRLALEEANESRRADYGGLALVFAELAGRHDAWKQALGDWNVKQSQQVLEWQRQARQEGQERGRLEQNRSIVLRLLQLRFGVVPVDIATAVNEITDLAVLDRWVDAAATVVDLAAFRAAISLHPAPPHAETNGA
jgi:hypothetical protein